MPGSVNWFSLLLESHFDLCNTDSFKWWSTCVEYSTLISMIYMRDSRHRGGYQMSSTLRLHWYSYPSPCNTYFDYQIWSLSVTSLPYVKKKIIRYFIRYLFFLFFLWMKCYFTSCTTAGQGFPLLVSVSECPTLSSNSDGTETSFMFPLARSNRNSAGFMAIKGEHPMDEK